MYLVGLGRRASGKVRENVLRNGGVEQDFAYVDGKKDKTLMGAIAWLPP